VAALEEGARILRAQAGDVEFEARVRIDTPNEWQYYRHDGILRFMLRQLAG
jgi:aconitate hydratase